MVMIVMLIMIVTMIVMLIMIITVIVMLMMSVMIIVIFIRFTDSNSPPNRGRVDNPQLPWQPGRRKSFSWLQCALFEFLAVICCDSLEDLLTTYLGCDITILDTLLITFKNNI